MQIQSLIKFPILIDQTSLYPFLSHPYTLSITNLLMSPTNSLLSVHFLHQFLANYTFISPNF